MDSLEEAMAILNAKDDIWENIKEHYPDFTLEYGISILEEGYSVEVFIYDKNE